MRLTQKILLFTSLLVVGLVGSTLLYTAHQADRLAHATIDQGLKETRETWETFQADRYNKLKLGVTVLGNDPAFKSLVETNDQATVLNTLQERGSDLKVDFFVVTDPDGLVVARSDRPEEQGTDLSQDPLIARALEGEESAAVWRQADRLYHVVAVPMRTGPDLKGVLIAGYGLNEALASDIRKLTHSEIAYLANAQGQPPQLTVSSLGPKEGELRGMLPAPGTDLFTVNLSGEPHMGVQVPLKTASDETVGTMLALRSLNAEKASFHRFRNSLVVASLVVMAIALALAYLVASRITHPVRRLVSLVESARDGTYSGAVTVDTNDEIGILARSFNKLLADLREKEQLIGFLNEGMTSLKRGAAVGSVTTPTLDANASTAGLDVVNTGAFNAQPGTLFADRYEIRDTLGRGGMGVVYRAHDRKLDEDVALKLLRPDVMSEDPTLLARFKQEIKLARKITHRNVLRTHDFGETGGTPYISMEYLEGVTLKDLIRNKGALPVAVGLRIAKQICLGLEAAHVEGVVHRDIKPQNMLILPESGEVKIMDFGIARVSEMDAGASGLTSAGTVMGTPDYMPPEQAQGQPADFRSDLYSLGVVLYEIFTGQVPFTGETPMAVVLNHIQQTPKPPTQLNPKLPIELERVILRCLEKSPTARYAKVGDLLDALSEVSSRTEASAA